MMSVTPGLRVDPLARRLLWLRFVLLLLARAFGSSCHHSSSSVLSLPPSVSFRFRFISLPVVFLPSFFRKIFRVCSSVVSSSSSITCAFVLYGVRWAAERGGNLLAWRGGPGRFLVAGIGCHEHSKDGAGDGALMPCGVGSWTFYVRDDGDARFGCARAPLISSRFLRVFSPWVFNAGLQMCP